MKEYHHGNLRELLLEEGLKLLSDDGIENFSLRKLARRCGVSHNSPYRHFADKEELILAIGQEIEEKFNKALKEGIAEAGTPEDMLLAMGRGYIHFFLDHPDYLELLFLSPGIHDVVKEQHSHKGGTSLITYLTAAAAAGMGEIPEGLEKCTGPEIFRMISGKALQPWCLIHGLTVLLVKKAIPCPEEEDLDRLITQVLTIS